MGALEHAFLYLLAAVVAVPVAARLGLGSVLGYLIAGVVLGPVLGLVGAESEEIKHFAEFGVVMMLFLVGLELQPKVLWRMRNRLLGLGGLQVGLTTLAFTGAGLALGVAWQSAVAIGMTLALSSTAIVLQTLGEKGWMKSPAGQSSFSVLLFQDIAVIPMLALLPLLAVTEHAAGGDGHHGGALDGLPGWLRALAILGSIAGIVLAGRFLVRPVFRFVARTRLREVFTAVALLLVIGVALLMSVIGLSPALGTFLAGVVLSGSEYRRELEGDIDPFKGLLLGLFFLSVGAGIDFGLLASAPGTVVGLAAGLMVVKLLVLLAVGALFGLRGATLWLFGLGLAQAGEFAFVLFGFAQVSGVIATEETQVLVLAVALTMFLTPALFVLYERVIAPRAVADGDGGEADVINERGTAVVAGVGRFGLVVSRMLSTNGYRVVVLDHDADLVELLRRLGIETFYGDASRPDLLEQAGLAEARLFVAALDDRHRQTEVVRHVAQTFPECRIIARARDYQHQFELERAGAHWVQRELIEGALAAGRRALIELGTHPFKAERQSRAFRRHDEQLVEDLRAHWTDEGLDKSFVGAARARVARLADMMESDRMAERHDTSERGWTPPPKDDVLI